MDVTLEAIAAEISKQLEGAEGRLVAQVSTEISKQLEGVEGRLTTYVSGEITKHLQAVTATVTESGVKLQGVFGDSEARIKKHIDEFENRAEQRLKMHFESMEEKVMLAAEGYGGTLEGIERRLSDLNKKVEYVRKAPSKKRVPPHN